MTYNMGDHVLVSRVTGSLISPPAQATVIGPAFSYIYSYVINLNNQPFNVKEDWICPATITIQELSDTPWL